ncbi:MAG: Hpt domain-containing protein [Magnetovibrio sp.]|nr:Hpt domain-containing protein [Magnetovibrio sp.]
MSCIEQLVEDVGLESAQRLIGMFRDDVADRIKFIEGFVDNNMGDLKELHRHAHTLKGMCMTYGALKGAEAANELQEICEVNDEALILEKSLAALNIIPFDVKAVVSFMTIYAQNIDPKTNVHKE